MVEVDGLEANGEPLIPSPVGATSFIREIDESLTRVTSSSSIYAVWRCVGSGRGFTLDGYCISGLGLHRCRCFLLSAPLYIQQYI